MLDPAGRSLVSREGIDIVSQTDPFYAECRAYGRIASKPRKRPIAIACHGFTSIPEEQEFFIAQNFNITDWNRSKKELLLETRQPLRALVKDLVEVDPAITQTLIASMRRELKALKGVIWWISAWTEPHFEFRKDINSKWDIDMNRQIDLAAFNKMVMELGMDVRTNYIARLRPRN
jgi:hypothetical protein